MNSCCGNNRRKAVVKKAKHIVEGWSNLISKKFKQTWWVKQRAQICYRCVNLNKKNKFCKLCGCYIPAKITVKKEKCPFSYWGEVN